MRPFLVCVHDVTPPFANEIVTVLRDLAPLVGRDLSLGIVPNWHYQWSLLEHADFCASVTQHSNELLLHGYSHRRQRGIGPVSWLAERSDEMNGLSLLETRLCIAMGQQTFTEAFGEPARGFLAPAWQQGEVRKALEPASALEYTLGFFSLARREGNRIPLATFTWDCGRWSVLGHAGHSIGALLHTFPNRVPVLAVHPRDWQRGYGPQIIRLVQSLLTAGFEPATPSALTVSPRRMETDVAEITL